MSKGAVYIVNTQKLDQVYCRVTVSKVALKSIHYMEAKKLFLTVCEELNLSVRYYGG